MNSYSLSLHLTIPSLFDVKELVVTECPHKDWQEVNTRALLEICRLHKVEKITLTAVWGPNDLKKLAQLAPPSFVFLPRLRYIESKCRGEEVDFVVMLLPWTRIKNITWSLDYLPVGAGSYDFCHAIMILLNAENVFDTNYTVRDMTFRNEKGLIGLDEGTYHLQGVVSNWLYRNRRIFRRCQKSITVLLGLMRRKRQQGTCVLLFSLVGRDAMQIVINMVWETRDTKVWETWKKCGSAI